MVPSFHFFGADSKGVGRMKFSSQFGGHLAAFFTISVWGVTFISTKVLLVDFSPVEIMLYRFILAVLVLSIASPPVFKPGDWNMQAVRAEWKLVFAGLCGVTLYFLFQNIALSYTLAANASVLTSVAPFFTALVSRALLKEKLKAHFFLGFVLAITGIVMIAFNGSVVLKLNPLGDILCVLAALVWAFYSITIKTLNPSGPDVLAVTRKVFSYGLGLTFLFLPFFKFQPHPGRLLEMSNLLNMAFLGVMASALCYLTWNYAVHVLGPVRTSVYIYMLPVIAIAASALILHEKITLVSGAGMALILMGMALSEWQKGAG